MIMVHSLNLTITYYRCKSIISQLITGMELKHRIPSIPLFTITKNMSYNSSAILVTSHFILSRNILCSKSALRKIINLWQTYQQ